MTFRAGDRKHRSALAIAGALLTVLGWLSPAASQPMATFTPGACPVATPEPFWVEPVTSPTDALSQVIRVHIGNGDRVEVVAETGHFFGDVNGPSPFEVAVHLEPERTHHLEVIAYVKRIDTPSGCTYGDYTLRTTVDRFGAPLEIVQHGQAPTPTPVLVDLSGFTDFDFQRRNGLGFCPPLDAVFSAAIRGRAGLGYELEMTLLQAGQRGVDECLPQCCAEVDCAVAVELPPRILDQAEANRIQAAFVGVPLISGPDPRCDTVAFDPCMIVQARWDLITAVDEPCTGGRRLEPATVDEIAALLESLRPDRTPPPSPTPTPTPVPPTSAPSPTFLPEPLLTFEFSAVPEHPRVGDSITLTVRVRNTRGFAGQPTFSLAGARPYFAMEAPTIEPEHLTILRDVTLTYTLRAEQPGRAELRAGAAYEICLITGSSSPCYRGGSTSEPFAIEIGETTTAASSGSGCSATPRQETSPPISVVLMALAILCAARRSPRSGARTSVRSRRSCRQASRTLRS